MACGFASVDVGLGAKVEAALSIGSSLTVSYLLLD